MASTAFHSSILEMIMDKFCDVDGRQRCDEYIADEIIEWLEGTICPRVIDAMECDCADMPNIVCKAFEKVMGIEGGK